MCCGLRAWEEMVFGFLGVEDGKSEKCVIWLNETPANLTRSTRAEQSAKYGSTVRGLEHLGLYLHLHL